MNYLWKIINIKYVYLTELGQKEKNKEPYIFTSFVNILSHNLQDLQSSCKRLW